MVYEFLLIIKCNSYSLMLERITEQMLFMLERIFKFLFLLNEFHFSDFFLLLCDELIGKKKIFLVRKFKCDYVTNKIEKFTKVK